MKKEKKTACAGSTLVCDFFRELHRAARAAGSVAGPAIPQREEREWSREGFRFQKAKTQDDPVAAIAGHGVILRALFPHKRQTSDLLSDFPETREPLFVSGIFLELLFRASLVGSLDAIADEEFFLIRQHDMDFAAAGEHLLDEEDVAPARGGTITLNPAMKILTQRRKGANLQKS